jgi:hypothetical protein
MTIEIYELPSSKLYVKPWQWISLLGKCKMRME